MTTSRRPSAHNGRLIFLSLLESLGTHKLRWIIIITIKTIIIAVILYSYSSWSNSRNVVAFSLRAWAEYRQAVSQ